MKLRNVILAAVAACALAGSADAYSGPGHIALIGGMVGANFNSTADQAIPILPQVSKFRISEIDVTNCSTSLTLAAGGFYSAASKGGTAIVAAAQVYSAATGSTIVVNPTVSATGGATAWALSTIYLALTVAQGSAATCNVAIYGVDLTGF